MTLNLFFRKYFWTVNFLFIFLAAYAVARTGNSFLEAAILPLPKGDAARSVARPAPVERPPLLNLERMAQLTGLPLPVPEPEVSEPAELQDSCSSTPQKTSLRVRLLGTLLGSRPEWSIASILSLGTQRAQTYMIGDRIEGAEILAIERQRVVVCNNHRGEYINNEAGDGVIVNYTPPEKRPFPSPGDHSPSVLGTGIRAISENAYEVPRAEIDKTLSNLNDVAMQARIVPAFKDGQAQGFKLFSIRPDSIYTKIGIQNGDVIRRINGYDLNSPEKALEIYSRLKEASRIDIQVERNGTLVNKTYNIH